MMKDHGPILLLLLLTLFSCEELQEFEPSGSFEPKLVVEAMITSEHKRHKVKLSETFASLNQSPPPVTNALVAIVVNNDDPKLLTHDPQNSGTYLTDSMRALFGKFYGLYILHDDQEYISFSSPNFGAPVEPLDIREQENGLYKYVYTESSEPSMMEVAITWNETGPDNMPVARELISWHYTLDVIDINKIFAPEKEELLFPAGATVVRRKFSLTTDHQEFLRSFLSETEWRGSIFDVAPGNVSTNISGGALGYFWVSIVRKDDQVVQ